MSSSSPKSRGSDFTADGVKDYERRRYRGIDQRIVHAREVRLISRMLDAIRDDGGENRNRRILDMPCGYGRFTDLLARRGYDVVNGDLSFEMVFRAGEKAGPPGVVADAKRGLPFRAGVFDVVFSVRFLHHVHDVEERRAVLSEFYRTTSRWIIVSFYRAGGLHAFQRRVRRMFKKGGARIKMIEPGRFEAEAGAAGFEVIRVLPLFRGVHAYHLALLKK